MRIPEKYCEPLQLGTKTVSGRFVIPSGIRCTNGSTIERVFHEVPSVGVITTKSISVLPRQGYREPIYATYLPGSYINAVGLTNPGAEAFFSELSAISIPDDKFLLVSIFGGNANEFVQAARCLEPVADGFELNMSCPHAEGYGIEVGHVRDLVKEITLAVCKAVSVPVIVKLSATCPTLEETALGAVEAGAVGISAVNTVGPSMHRVGGEPILANGVGGLSGEGIRPLALNAVRRIREAVGHKTLIIGMGGLTQASHVKDFADCGADLFGVGSALTGMDSRTMAVFFSRLHEDLIAGTDTAARIYSRAPRERMAYHRLRLVDRKVVGKDTFKLITDDAESRFFRSHKPGTFYFLCVPGVGEKPFALFSIPEKSFVVKKVGVFTEFLSQYEIGKQIWIRGPYGKPAPSFADKTVVLVGGGTGVVPLYELARDYVEKNRVVFLLGARTADELFELETFRDLGGVRLATEDGSLEHKGLVTDLIENVATDFSNRDLAFVNSGPERMVLKAFEIEQALEADSEVWGSIAFMTSCGVGICGRCSAASGLLSCVDGHFMPAASFEKCSYVEGHASEG